MMSSDNVLRLSLAIVLFLALVFDAAMREDSYGQGTGS